MYICVCVRDAESEVHLKEESEVHLEEESEVHLQKENEVHFKIQDSRWFYCHMRNNYRAVAGNEILMSWAPPTVQ